MGLKGDFSELTQVWHQSPWRVKLYLLLSGFLAGTSLASLSESVVKWKGFILTGITFYREYLRTPIVELLVDWVHISIEPQIFDFLLPVTVVFGALIRVAVFDLRAAQSRRSQLAATKNLLLVLVGLLLLLFTEFLWPRRSGLDYTEDIRNSILLYVSMTLYALWRPRDAGEMLIGVYLLGPPIFVCIAAAVNLGLK